MRGQRGIDDEMRIVAYVCVGGTVLAVAGVYGFLALLGGVR